jgi:hypothetical protein
MGDQVPPRPIEDRLVSLIERLLLNQPQGGYRALVNLYIDVRNRAGIEQVAMTPETFVEHWWRFAQLGIIALAGGRGETEGIPEFVLTARGRTLLEHGQESPHHAARYLAAVRRRVGVPDEIVVGYLEEAVAAWAAGQYRSSAVMVGCVRIPLKVNAGSGIVIADSGDRERSVGAKRR